MSEENELDELTDSSTPSKPEKKSSAKSFIIEMCIYAVVIILCVFFVPKYVLQRTVVNGDSMESTLQSQDSLLVNKIGYRFSDPSRFDIIVFYPYGKEVNDYYIKRVIGLPGEIIQIKGSSIYINGKLLKESYGKDPIVYQGIAEQPLKLGKDEFFVLGDNRDISFDSRYEEVGPISRNKIDGKAFVRIWPLNKFGFIK